MNNYLGEKIPDFEKISLEINDTIINNDHNKIYSFQELFTKHQKGYYEKNITSFTEIGFNTKLKENDKRDNEIKGLYILYFKNKPQYVGISRKLIRRLRNHFLGKTHFEASLVYLIARNNYDNELGIYQGTRNDFPFENYRSIIQEEMINNWTIEIIPELDNYKLYFLEIAIACKLKTKWNSFETH